MTTLSQRLLVPFDTKLPGNNVYQPYGNVPSLRTYPRESCDDMNQVENVLKFLKYSDVPDAVSSILLDPKKKKPSILVQIQDKLPTMTEISSGLYKKVYELPQILCRGKGDKFIYKKVNGEVSKNSTTEVVINPNRASSGCSAYWENFQMLIDDGTGRTTIHQRLQFFCTNTVIEAFANIYTSDLLLQRYTPHLLYTPDQYIEYALVNSNGKIKRVFTSHCIQEKISGDVYGDFIKMVPRINNTVGITNTIPQAVFLLSLQIQIAYTLYILQKTLRFRHNDLWLRNLYFRMTNLTDSDFAGKMNMNKKKYSTYQIGNTKFHIKNTGFRVIISDFDRCRFETANVVFNNYDMYENESKITEFNISVNSLEGWEFYDYLYQLVQWLWILLNQWSNGVNPFDIKYQIITLFIMIVHVLSQFPNTYADVNNLFNYLDNNMVNNNPSLWISILGNTVILGSSTVNVLFNNIFGITLTDYLAFGQNFNIFIPRKQLTYKFDLGYYIEWLNILKSVLAAKNLPGSTLFFADNVANSDTYIFSDKIIDNVYTAKNVSITDKYYKLNTLPVISTIEPPKVTMKEISITPGGMSYVMIPATKPTKSIGIGKGVEVYEFSSMFPSLGYMTPSNPGFVIDGWNMKILPIENTKQYITVVYIPKTSFRYFKPSLYHYDAPATLEEREKNPKKSLAQIFGTIGYTQTGVIMTGNYFNYKTWRKTSDGKYEINRPENTDCNPVGCIPPTCDKNVGYYKTEDMNSIVLDDPIPEPYKQYYGVVNINMTPEGTMDSASITKQPDSVSNIVLSGAPVLVHDTWSFDNELSKATDKSEELVVKLSNPLLNLDIFGLCVGQNVLGGFLNHGMGANPRMVLGINSAGDLLLVNVEGRNERGGGVDFTQLSRLVKSLGCKYAINLDGGKTSDIIYKPQNSIPSVLVNTNPVHKLENVLNPFNAELLPGLYPSTALMFKE
jgi:hypothetical protein